MLSRLSSHSGYTAWRSLVIFDFRVVLSSCTSRQIKSLRWVMIEDILRSPKLKTRSTISCSTSCTHPPSVPSRTIAFISSSVIPSFWDESPKKRHTPAVLLVSIHTKGDAIYDNHDIGLDTIFATRSEAIIPIRLGTNSPIIRVKYVTIITMMACAKPTA